MTMPIRPLRSLTQALLLSAAIAAPVFAADFSPAFAQDQATDQPAGDEAGDPVVATVNGQEIYRSEVVEAIQGLPEQYRQVPVEVLIPALAEQVAIGRLIRQQAEEAGLADDPAVRERVDQARTNILQEVWLERQVDERMTDEAVQDAYQAFLEANPPAEEVRARHILVETEEEAESIIGQLDEGADFGELAREHSIGPSGEAGGDLGWFQEGQMVAPFGEVAFALEVGDYTEDPVETQFGWHVIVLDDRRTPEPPPLEEVREQIESQLAQVFVQDVIADVRADADIQVIGMEEEPAGPENGPETEPEAAPDEEAEDAGEPAGEEEQSEPAAE